MALTVVDEAVEGDTGSGVFVPTFFSGTQIIAKSTNGSLLTITPPTGERVSLVGLTTEFGVSNISISVGDVNVITGDMPSSIGVGSFSIMVAGGKEDQSQNGGRLPPLIGGVDETIVISTTTATAQILYYSYCFGVIK